MIKSTEVSDLGHEGRLLIYAFALVDAKIRVFHDVANTGSNFLNFKIKSDLQTIKNVVLH